MIKKVRIQGYRIYKDLILQPNLRLNLIVGGNESGKSSLLEAIALALTGRVNGRGAFEELNLCWFNTDLVENCVLELATGNRVPWPEIRIELFLDNRDEASATLRRDQHRCTYQCVPRNHDASNAEP